MADVVGKTIFSDGKGKLFFGYYKTDDGVQFVDYKTWKKLSFKDVSKGDTNKERVIKAILKNQKQFNKKVEFNMWAKQKKRTFEETMDWFIQNGWINNINKGGIKESVNEGIIQDREKQLKDLKQGGSVNGGGYGPFKKTGRDTFVSPKGKKYNSSALIKLIGTFGDFKVNESVNEGKDSNMFYVLYQKQGVFGKPAAVGYKDRKDAEKFANSLKNHNTMILDKQSMKNLKGVDVKESVNEATSSMSKEISSMTGTRQPAVQQFIDKHNINALKLAMYLNKQGLRGRMDFATALAGKPGNPIQKKMIKMFQESVNEAKFGYKDSTASYINKHNNEYKIAEKMNKRNEQKFYDDLQAMEDKIGHSKTMLFISNALRGYKVDMFKDPKIKNPADAQEALFLLSK